MSTSQQYKMTCITRNAFLWRAASLTAVVLLFSGHMPSAAQLTTSSKSVSFERITNGHIFFSLSEDGRKFELGFASEVPMLSGDRGLFDMMVALGNRHEWGIVPEEQTADGYERRRGVGGTLRHTAACGRGARGEHRVALYA